MQLAPASSTSPVAAIERLASQLRGGVLWPSEDAYHTARRGHNLAHDLHPVAIVRPADAGDVALAVALARETGLELAVRSGGHSIAAHSSGNGVLVIDLGDMKTLDIDRDAGLVSAQPGLTAGEVTNVLAAHNLAIPFGDTPTVGIAGLTLGGGIGYLARKHGLAIDHLEAVELVTADGRVLTVDEHHEPDLYWAVRGGGGNFGIVTRLVYRAVPVTTVYGGALVLPASAETLVSIVRAGEAAPDGLTLIAETMPAPPAPFIPAAWVGRPIIYLTSVFAGDPADGPAAFAPFRALAEPIADLVGEMPYAGIYAFTEEAGNPMPYHLRSSFLKEFDHAAAEAVLAAVETVPMPFGMFHFRVLGGAMARVPAEATAFAHRRARFLAMILAAFDPTEGDGAAARTWATSLHADLLPYASGAYSNFLGDEGEDRVREAYPLETYRRLAGIKRAYDPDNVFRRNQNILPDGAEQELVTPPALQQGIPALAVAAAE
jgi:FAD/FMN-containing dehydrogenase